MEAQMMQRHHCAGWRARTVATVLSGLTILLVLGCAEQRPPIPAAIPANPGQQSMQSQQTQASVGESYKDCGLNIVIRCASGTWVVNYDCPKGEKCPGRMTIVIGADGNLVRVEEIPANYQLHGFGIYEDEFSPKKETFLKINVTSAPINSKDDPYAYSVGNFKGLQKGNNHWEGHLNGPGPNDTWVSLPATADLK